MNVEKIALDDMNNGGVFKWEGNFYIKTYEVPRDRNGEPTNEDGYECYLRLSDNQILPAKADWREVPECYEDVEYYGNIDSLLVESLPGLSDKATRNEVALDTLHTMRYQIVNRTMDINPKVSAAYMYCVNVIDKMIKGVMDER